MNGLISTNSTQRNYKMQTTVLMAALVASAALIAPVQAGNGRGGGGSGGGGFAAARSGGARGGGGAPSFRSMPSGRFGGGASFRSMPMRNFSGNQMVYSGQRFSSVGVRSPRMTEFRSRPLNSNMSAPLAGRQFTGGNAGINRTNQFRNNQRVVQNGGGFARNNNVIRNRTGAGQFRNGNRLASNWRNHVVAQHSANWHRDWDRHHDHFFHGNRFVFIDGFWWGFGLGFDPWWDYPYYGYGYGYPDNYGYSRTVTMMDTVPTIRALMTTKAGTKMVTMTNLDTNPETKTDTAISSRRTPPLPPRKTVLPRKGFTAVRSTASSGPKRGTPSCDSKPSMALASAGS